MAKLLSPARLARTLYWFSLIALIVYPLALLLNLITVDIARAYVDAFPELRITAPPEGWRLAALLGLDTVEILVTLAILWQVRGVFAAFARSVEPTLEVANRLARAGALILVQVVLGVIVRAGESVLLTWPNAPGERQLSIAFASPDFALLIAGGLLLCTGHALRAGSAAMDENKGFI